MAESAAEAVVSHSSVLPISTREWLGFLNNCGFFKLTASILMIPLFQISIRHGSWLAQTTCILNGSKRRHASRTSLRKGWLHCHSTVWSCLRILHAQLLPWGIWLRSARNGKKPPLQISSLKGTKRVSRSVLSRIRTMTHLLTALQTLEYLLYPLFSCGIKVHLWKSLFCFRAHDPKSVSL